MKLSQITQPLKEGPCDVATKDDIAHMTGPEYDKYALWKEDCEDEIRRTPQSAKRFSDNYKDMKKTVLKQDESYDDYHGDMSKEEYDKVVDNSEMEYTVWIGGTEPNDNWLTYDEAITLYDKFKAQGYDDIQLDARIKQEIPQDIPMGIRPYPKGVITKGKASSLDLRIFTSKRALAEKDNKTESRISDLRNFIIFRQSNTFELLLIPSLHSECHLL